MAWPLIACLLLPGLLVYLGLHIVRREIIFVSDACIWSVALSVPNAPLGDDAGVLEQFLTTLKVRS